MSAPRRKRPVAPREIADEITEIASRPNAQTGGINIRISNGSSVSMWMVVPPFIVQTLARHIANSRNNAGWDDLNV